MSDRFQFDIYQQPEHILQWFTDNLGPILVAQAPAYWKGERWSIHRSTKHLHHLNLTSSFGALMGKIELQTHSTVTVYCDKDATLIALYWS